MVVREDEPLTGLSEDGRRNLESFALAPPTDAEGRPRPVLVLHNGHGRAKTVASPTLKGHQRCYEYEVLCRLRDVLPAAAKVTVLADWGFADCKLFCVLATNWALHT